jgi:hypothetical protein
VLTHAQAKPLQYQPMYVPKSNQQIMNEVMIQNATIQNEIEQAKKFFLLKDYEKAYNHANQAEKYQIKYFKNSNVTAIYLMGRCFQINEQFEEAKKCLDYAKKYGLTSDSQVFE